MKRASIQTRDHVDSQGRRNTRSSGFLASKDTLLAAGKILHAEECPRVPGGMLWLGGDGPEDHLKIEGDDDHCQYFRTAIASMTEEQKKEFRKVLKKYGAGMQLGHCGSMVTDAAASNRREYAAASQMNKDATAFWAERTNRGVYDADSARPPRSGTARNLAAEMNAEARRFWNQDAS
jgi:hypothetical protein